MNDRSEPGSIDVLLEAARSRGPHFEPDELRAAQAIYRHLVDGTPVDAEAIAKAAGWDRSRAHRFLNQLPQAERDDHGRVVGFGGLALRTTPHRVIIDNTVRYAWCAWDTLFLPVVLNTTLEVASQCPTTGEQIALTVAPDGIVDRHPKTAVMSFARPARGCHDDQRADFCALIHFFADGDAAKAWTGQVENSFLLPLDEAFELGRRCTAELYGEPR